MSAQRSPICHEKAKSGVSASKKSEKRDVRGSSYESLAYSDVEKKSQVTTRHREERVRSPQSRFGGDRWR